MLLTGIALAPGILARMIHATDKKSADIHEKSPQKQVLRKAEGTITVGAVRCWRDRVSVMRTPCQLREAHGVNER
jgi:hypothetical protein